MMISQHLASDVRIGAQYSVGRAFTIRELFIVLVFVITVATLIWGATRTRQPTAATSLKEATHLRGIIQSFHAWAQNNGDVFPLPSIIDRNDATVRAAADAKDTTANIMSMLVFSGFLPPDMLVSPNERNPSIRPMHGYAYTSPSTAVDPATALWDPALNADFTNGRAHPAHVSYAHGIPRPLNLWANSSASTQGRTPIVGNRRPRVTAVQAAQAPGVRVTASGTSNTYGMLGSGRSSWKGLVCYSDSIEDVTGLGETGSVGLPTYVNRAGQIVHDVLFFDEATNPKLGAPEFNSYMGIFINSGKERKDFTPIWD